MKLKDLFKLFNLFVYYNPLSGTAYYNNSECVVVESHTEPEFQKGLEELVGVGAAKRIIHNAFKKSVKGFITPLWKKHGLKTIDEKINSLKKLGLAMGMGVIKSIKKVDDSYSVIFTNSFNVLAYPEKMERPVCHVITAFIEGAFEEALGKPVKAYEIHCEAMGHDYNEVIIIPSYGEKTRFSPQFNYKKKMQDLGKQRVWLNPINANLTFFGSRSIIFNRAHDYNVLKELDKVVGPRAANGVFYRANVKGVRELVKKIKWFFSIFRFLKTPLMKILIRQVGVRGLGKAELVSADTKNDVYELTIKNSFIGSFYKKQKLPRCSCFVGWFEEGLSIILGREMKCEEVKCVAMGDRVCRFVLKPADQ